MLANESGSMTREFFLQFVDYFCDRMEEVGYDRKNGRGHNVIVLMDGHTSRWNESRLE